MTYAVELFTYQTNPNISRLKWDTRELWRSIFITSEVHFIKVSFHIFFNKLRKLNNFVSNLLFVESLFVATNKNDILYNGIVRKVLWWQPVLISEPYIWLRVGVRVKIGVRMGNGLDFYFPYGGHLENLTLFINSPYIYIYIHI